MAPETPPALWVVDDDPTFQRVLARALERRGFAALGISSATEAEARLQRAAQPGPDFAVVDLNLAGDSGLRLIRALAREEPALPHRDAHGLCEHRDGRGRDQARRRAVLRQADRRRRARSGAAGRRGPRALGSSRPPAQRFARRVGAHPARARRARGQRLGDGARAPHAPPDAPAQARASARRTRSLAPGAARLPSPGGRAQKLMVAAIRKLRPGSGANSFRKET